MFERLREDWRTFKASKSGFRFRDRRRRRQRIGRSGFDLRKALYVAGGLVIAITSLLLAPLPGPGWGTFFVGLMILPGELLIVARFWIEPKRYSEDRRGGPKASGRACPP
jgi:hypothetical protein